MESVFKYSDPYLTVGVGFLRSGVPLSCKLRVG